MNSKILFILLIFTVGDLKAQSVFQQLTVGIGGGAVTTYTTSPTFKLGGAFNGNVGYYPTSFLNIEVEGQIGKLIGSTLTQPNINFTNSYQAAILGINLQLGAFIRSQSPAGDFFKNIYIGSGFSMIHNEIRIVDNNTFYQHHITPMIPVKLGYEFSLVKKYEAPLLKIDIAGSYNHTIGEGLFGYFGGSSQSFVYYSVTLKYAINLNTPPLIIQTFDR